MYITKKPFSYVGKGFLRVQQRLYGNIKKPFRKQHFAYGAKRTAHDVSEKEQNTGFSDKKHDREYVLLQNKEEIKISGEKPLIRQ